MAGPTLSGFLQFVRNTMGITTAVLPDNSPWIQLALAVSLAIVNPDLASLAVPQVDSTGASLNPGNPTIDSLYTQAVYNLAADNLINYAQDVPDAPAVAGSGDPGLPFFQWTRKQLNINGFVPGLLQSSSDEGTSSSYVVQDAAKMFTLKDLQNLKTIYGRTYLGIAQGFGPSPYGMS